MALIKIWIHRLFWRSFLDDEIGTEKKYKKYMNMKGNNVAALQLQQ